MANQDTPFTLFSGLNCCKIDVLCLQETHSISETELSLWLKSTIEDGLFAPSYSCISHPGSHHSCRVAIIFKSTCKLSSYHADTAGRSLCAQLTLQNNLFQICNIYTPNTSTDGAGFFYRSTQFWTPQYAACSVETSAPFANKLYH